MNSAIFKMASLFDQLGLESTDDAIIKFIHQHQLSAGEAMEDASFWTPSQVQLFKQAREQDSDWVELVDELETLLSKSKMKP